MKINLNMTREEAIALWGKDEKVSNVWDGIIDELQRRSALENVETATREEIDALITPVLESDADIEKILDIFQSLTVPRGEFVPDWSKAPKWAGGISCNWSRDTQADPNSNEVAFIPRPAPTLRKLSNDEMCEAWCYHWIDMGVHLTLYRAYKDLARKLASGATIEQLCKDSKIAVEVET